MPKGWKLTFASAVAFLVVGTHAAPARAADCEALRYLKSGWEWVSLGHKQKAPTGGKSSGEPSWKLAVPGLKAEVLAIADFQKRIHNERLWRHADSLKKAIDGYDKNAAAEQAQSVAGALGNFLRGECGGDEK
jgi:hypothetical protein